MLVMLVLVMVLVVTGVGCCGQWPVLPVMRQSALQLLTLALALYMLSLTSSSASNKPAAAVDPVSTPFAFVPQILCCSFSVHLFPFLPSVFPLLDVWSLDVVLVYCLTKRTPFQVPMLGVPLARETPPHWRSF